MYKYTHKEATRFPLKGYDVFLDMCGRGEMVDT